MTLLGRALGSLVALLSALAAVLMVSAGTLHYWQAWVYLAIFAATSAAATFDLAARDPELLQRRMRGGPGAEREPAQRLIMLLASIGFVALLVVSALDYRRAWSSVSPVVSAVADALVAAGFLAIMRVYRENTYSAATIEVTAGQRVIATGPYAIVRHPMYAAGLVYLAATPPALGSYYGLLVMVVMTPVIVARLLNEEHVLERDLPGYRDYERRVPYRLIPRVW